MDTKHLLTLISSAFHNSTHSQSQQLLEQIIRMAAKNLNTNHLNHSHKPTDRQPKKSRISKIKSLRKRPRKIISKQKLKESAIKRISSQNKKLHLKHSNLKHSPQPISQKQSSVPQCYSLLLHPEKEEQKLQQSQSHLSSCFGLLSIKKPLESIQKIKEGESLVSLQIEEKFKKTKQNFAKYLKSNLKEPKADELTCPICIQILIDPVSTGCGHSFCLKCLDESLLFASTCPVCRFYIKGIELFPCQYLQKLIKLKCDEFLDDEAALKNYTLRRELNQKWKKERFIECKNLIEGFLLDVRDTQNIWCKARILKVYSVNNRTSSVLVHYEQWARLYDQIIDIKSTRLAPRDHFSSRTDLPRYNLNMEEQNLRGAVITGSNSMNRPGGNIFDLSNVIELVNVRGSSINNQRQSGMQSHSGLFFQSFFPTNIRGNISIGLRSNPTHQIPGDEEQESSQNISQNIQSIILPQQTSQSLLENPFLEQSVSNLFANREGQSQNDGLLQSPIPSISGVYIDHLNPNILIQEDFISDASYSHRQSDSESQGDMSFLSNVAIRMQNEDDSQNSQRQQSNQSEDDQYLY